MIFRIVFSTVFLLPFLSVLGNAAFGQSAPKSVQTWLKVRTPQEHSSTADSLQLKSRNKLSLVDSIQGNQQLRSVESSNNSLDSIQGNFRIGTDSLMSAYKNQLSRLDSLKSVLRKELDSMTNANMAGNFFAEKLDSLTKLQNSITNSFQYKLQLLKEQATSKITQLNLPPEVEQKAIAIKGNINNLKIPNSNLKIPGFDDFDNPLEKINEFGKVGELKGLNSSGVADQAGHVEIPKGLGDVSQLTNATGKVPDVPDNLTSYAKDVAPLPKADIHDVDNLSKIAEEKATDLSGIREIEKQAESLEQYKEIATKPPDQDSLKEMAIAQIRQVAVNHFAGKEQVLQEAMETMTKYKNRYSSVTSISDLPKKRANEMRGRPFVERIIPGIAMQIQKEGDDLMVDFNVYAAYRFTPKINAGVGWNQRAAYNTNYSGFISGQRIFGPRIFGEYALWKGFSPRVELEVMNTNVPAITTADPLKREWVWGGFVGVKKEYRFIRNIKGTAMIMTRVFNPDHKSPYADVLNVRFGFEFPMKKSKIQEQTN